MGFVSIDMYWKDVFIYIVCFRVLNSKGFEKEIVKTLIFNQEFSEDEIVDIIKKKFNKVQKVINVDCWSEALQLK